jgi:sulfur carrier protein ThiS
MRIIVKLIGPLIYEAGFSEKAMRLPAKITAGELVARVKIEKSRPTIITRNGRAVAPSDALKDGDRVVISHIYSGG